MIFCSVVIAPPRRLSDHVSTSAVHEVLLCSSDSRVHSASERVEPAGEPIEPIEQDLLKLLILLNRMNLVRRRGPGLLGSMVHGVHRVPFRRLMRFFWVRRVHGF